MGRWLVRPFERPLLVWNTAMVTQNDIVDGLHRLGLGPGSVLVVHASLSSFGHVHGGTEAVIGALEQTVTRRGLVIMPTHCLCMAGREDVRPFDPATSQAYTGRIPNVFWRQQDVLRSRHPTHSVAAWGDRAAKLLADHENRGPTGLDSPLHRSALWGGFILQLGVKHGSNTTLHVAEVLAGVPYVTVPCHKDWGDVALVRRADGGVDEVPMVNDERPGCSGGFPKIEPLLVERGLTHQTMIGSCRVRLTAAMPMIDVAVEMLKADPAALLCDRAECEHCTAAREAIRGSTL
jgi:aminoglycoside 3-N-acetyltransferase